MSERTLKPSLKPLSNGNTNHRLAQMAGTQELCPA